MKLWIFVEWNFIELKYKSKDNLIFGWIKRRVGRFSSWCAIHDRSKWLLHLICWYENSSAWLPSAIIINSILIPLNGITKLLDKSSLNAIGRLTFKEKFKRLKSIYRSIRMHLCYGRVFRWLSSVKLGFHI